MNDEEKLALKTSLKHYCVTLLEERLNTANDLIAAAQESANNDSKSSAGDKYETSRAMGHLQKEMYQLQAARIRQELLIAGSTELKLCAGAVKAGAIVLADDILVFVSVGLGRKVVAGRTVLFLSEDAPFYKDLYLKNVNDTITIAKQLYTIRDIW